MSIEINGRGGVVVKIIADSIVRKAPKGDITETAARGTTLELTYPRIVHSEFMTHRILSKNASSSRAVPIKDFVKLARETPAKPVEWGSNNPGMRSETLLDVEAAGEVERLWEDAARNAAESAEKMDALGAHKQIANRLLEPFQFMRTVVTGAEWNNFNWLRVDKDADPTIHELAKCMKEAMIASTPENLKFGQWHTPYVQHVTHPETGGFAYAVDGEDGLVYLTVEEALAISASCCAQVSYRRLNSTKDKALDIFGRLLSGNKVHASPFEHQLTPLPYHFYEKDLHQPWNWPKGVTSVTKNLDYYSGNIKGFVQHRQLLVNNAQHG